MSLLSDKSQNNKAKIAVLVSGGGTNLAAIIRAQETGVIKSGNIELVISNNKEAYALTRAKEADISTCVVDKSECGSQSAFEDEIIKTLDEYHIDLIVLAGFMCILSKKFTDMFPKRIINIHPSLIPSFCGEGMYGIHVHEAALKRGVKVSGATVHFVNEIADGGEIIAQKVVEVKKDDTPEELQARIMQQAEWIILPESIEIVSQKIVKEK